MYNAVSHCLGLIKTLQQVQCYRPVNNRHSVCGSVRMKYGVRKTTRKLTGSILEDLPEY